VVDATDRDASIGAGSIAASTCDRSGDDTPPVLGGVVLPQLITTSVVVAQMATPTNIGLTISPYLGMPK
jgi:hypothetical protein